jgi:hypothetical protein
LDNRGVAVLFDYFVAPSDAVAATVVDRIGGPGSSAHPAAPAAFPTVRAPGVDPVVLTGRLEELLTGRTFEEILDDPTSGPVAARDGGARAVVRLTTSLAEALARADESRLEAVAPAWSRSREFWGRGDPVALADLLRSLAAVARKAVDEEQAIYCWVCA